MDRPDASGVTPGPPHAVGGHYALESGLHTDRWYALDPMFHDPETLAPLVDRLAILIDPYQPTLICGPMTGGALLAQAVAMRMRLRLAWTQRTTHGAPNALFDCRYELPASLHDLVAGQRIAIVDDMISAGSAARATHDSLTRAGAVVAVLGTPYLMGDEAIAHFATRGTPLVCIERRPLHLWRPGDCPLCRRSEPLSTRTD